MTRAEQAALLVRTYSMLLRARERFRLRGVFWYTWMSVGPVRRASGPTMRACVTRAADGRITRKPAFFAFRRMARRLTRAG